MFPAVSLLILTAVAVDEGHSDRNPVYRQLREVGVVSGDAVQQLPRPTIPDGLPGDEQVKRLKELGGRRFPFDRLTRKSSAAPTIIHRSKLPSEGSPFRSFDIWFVAYGDLAAVDKDLLTRMLKTREKVQEESQQPEGAGNGHSFTTDELKARGIMIHDEEHESYGRVEFDLLDKVRLQMTGRLVWSRTDDSVMAAMIVDPRFDYDNQYPNQWLPLTKDEPGSPQPYTGAGLYLKVTDLERPVGALFVECHLVFVEPQEWFRGRDQLGAKLPNAIEAQARSARRDLDQATKALSGQ